MVLRPVTKSRIKLKLKRCPKCGVLVGARTRCKRCAKLLIKK